MDAGGGGGLFVSEVDLLCYEVLFSAVHIYILKRKSVENDCFLSHRSKYCFISCHIPVAVTGTM